MGHVVAGDQVQRGLDGVGLLAQGDRLVQMPRPGGHEEDRARDARGLGLPLAEDIRLQDRAVVRLGEIDPVGGVGPIKQGLVVIVPMIVSTPGDVVVDGESIAARRGICPTRTEQPKTYMQP